MFCAIITHETQRAVSMGESSDPLQEVWCTLHHRWCARHWSDSFRCQEGRLWLFRFCMSNILYNASGCWQRIKNCHKWLMAHRGAALLYVPTHNQYLMRTSIPTSAGYESSKYPTPGGVRCWDWASQVGLLLMLLFIQGWSLMSWNSMSGQVHRTGLLSSRFCLL